MLCGLLAPAQGQVLWQGQNVQRSREAFHQQLIYLGHAAALKDDLSPLENLQVAARLGGTAPDDALARQALADAGLGGRDSAVAPLVARPAPPRRVGAAAAGPGLAVGAGRTLQCTGHGGHRLAAGADRIPSAPGGLVVLTSHQAVGLSDNVAQVGLAL